MENKITREQILHELDLLSELSVFIPEDKKYWLVRTNSGQHFDSFQEHNYIAIGYNEIDPTKLRDAIRIFNNNHEHLYKEIRDIVKMANVPGHIGHASTHIYNFTFEMQEGDTVIIPSANSDYLMFGEVVNDKFYIATKDELDETNCNFKIRRNIRWKKGMRRSQVDPYFSKVFQSHHAINDVTKYQDYIERSIGSFYTYEDKTHLILNIDQNQDLSAEAVFGLGYNLIEIAKDYSDRFDLDLDFSELKIKIILNSPGKLEWVAKRTRSITLLSVLTIMLNGGGIKINDFEMQTPGLIKTVSELLDGSQDRKIKGEIVEKYMDSLKIQNPEEFVKVIKQFDDNQDLPK